MPKRYVNITDCCKPPNSFKIISQLEFNSIEEAHKDALGKSKLTETVRILSADEEKEFAWEWWKRCDKNTFPNIYNNMEYANQSRKDFEREWKEVNNG